MMKRMESLKSLKSKVVSSRSPKENVHLAKENVASLKEIPNEKVTEHVNKYLGRVRVLLQGSQEHPAVPAAVAEGIKDVLAEPSLLQLIPSKLPYMDFEARKDAVHIFNTVLRHPDLAGVRYMAANKTLLTTIAKGYDQLAIALNCGEVLRECLHHKELAKIVLYSDTFNHLFDWIELKEFEVASDAFNTFKELLTEHKTVVAEFLSVEYENVFINYTKLLKSTNYVTRRLSLKLLGELLLDRTNTNIMMRYIGDVESMKLMMMLLKDESKNIQYEAFHVFKVFVANPQKPPAIQTMLQQNKSKLLRYLETFQSDREDEQFHEEKKVLCQVLQSLPDM
mmetsp:Transcript_17287/g.23887  ORF Transcript_17287/g.23887 Transcript_17287/m.23887 type:complete len:338 (-) Transcript_17287:373-1386(-)|eukprot:CAMPEP_0196586176 /NCGR_PEP_ID=MMETSP1081-20130531/53427_1 /TAXON_ID=36882 /ORGANISM="Pyramimonas amylifera, Strain CCMP720" /LENGTH=337 /DNA_ID=CAMNT_0041907971 /DNA_START=165 /DNA_END=1178 /DNA_ORIENTATION=-